MVPNLRAGVATILASDTIVGVHLVAHDPPVERVRRRARGLAEELRLSEDGAGESGEDGKDGELHDCMGRLDRVGLGDVAVMRLLIPRFPLLGDLTPVSKRYTTWAPQRRFTV